MKSISLLFLLLGFGAALHAQQRIYVSQNATGANSGTSWADAFTDLQTALVSAQAGDEIWVAQGTYKPTNGSDRTLSFDPPSGIRLIGGFAGNETALAQRQWENHPTALSGDIGVAGDSTDNSYNVLYLFEPDSNTVVDGFFIRHGNADFSGPAEFRDRRQCGGGMYIMAGEMDAYALIINCVFEHNTARSHGGGLIENSFGEGSAGSLIQHCRFENNRSLGNGGGLAKYGNSWEERGEEITYCTFTQNRAQLKGGGAFYSDGIGNNCFDLSHCTFLENIAGDNGGGVYLALGKPGGALAVIKADTFVRNTSLSGHGIFLGEVFFSFVKKCSVDSLYFDSNGTSIFNVFTSAMAFLENSHFKINNISSVNDMGGFHFSSNAFIEVDNISISNSQCPIPLLIFNVEKIANISINQSNTIGPLIDLNPRRKNLLIENLICSDNIIKGNNYISIDRLGLEERTYQFNNSTIIHRNNQNLSLLFSDISAQTNLAYNNTVLKINRAMTRGFLENTFDHVLALLHESLSRSVVS
ncbi:MAG: hypothetical protein J0L99_14340 [Chitinophagales bacterium]|nr:hypothetical protein [Chitinophagales bacterium]